MSWSYGPPKDKTETITLLREAIGQGVNFFDTAEVYGPYHKEELLGEAREPFHGQVVIATKFGWAPASEDNSRWTWIKCVESYKPDRYDIIGAIRVLIICYSPRSLFQVLPSLRQLFTW